MAYIEGQTHRHSHLDASQATATRSNSSRVENPRFSDLQRLAESGFARKLFASYLIPLSYDRSIKWHRRLGTPIVREIIMSTVGSRRRAKRARNYKTDKSKSRLEAATDFALKGSVFNEVFHTMGVIPSSTTMAYFLAERRYCLAAVAGALTVSSLALVALQRYSRAIMIRRIDEELQNGEVFRSNYRNKFGIDARAVANYRAKS